MILPRRKFLTGVLGGLIAAPLVVKAENLMKVRQLIPPPLLLADWRLPLPPGQRFALKVVWTNVAERVLPDANQMKIGDTIWFYDNPLRAPRNS